MSTPDKTTPDTYEQTVNSLIKEKITKVDGKFVIPEDLELPSDIQAVLNAELRRRNTEAAFTKASQEAKLYKTEVEALKSKLLEESSVDLSSSELENLEELRITDPNQWRLEVNRIEEESKSLKIKEVEDYLSETRNNLTEKEKSIKLNEALNSFNSGSDSKITIEHLENDIPPRLLKSYESGKISLEELLEDAKTLIYGNPSIKQDNIPNEPNFNKIPGSDKEYKLGLENRKSDYNNIVM